MPPLVSHEEIVSPEGALIVVKRLHLTDEGRRVLGTSSVCHEIGPDGRLVPVKTAAPA